MRRSCRFHGEVITIKNGKYGSMYVPKEELAPKEGKKPSGDNALDRLREDIERIKDENIKRNRDNLDALYNIDMRNISPSMKRLFASWSDGIKKANASVETIANSQEAVVKLVAQYDKNIAAIQATANANSASISSIAQWQRETGKSIASIQQTASDNEASITQLVEVIGEDGETITASIKTAVINDESFIELVADRVTIEGTAEFVTRDELEDDSGSTVISGNLISLVMDGSEDDGSTTMTGTSELVFKYQNGEGKDPMGWISTEVDGDESNTSARYALLIETYPFVPSYTSTRYKPALKLRATGRMSLESGEQIYLDGDTFNANAAKSMTLNADLGIYAGALGGYITLDATSNTRIRANNTYEGSYAMDTPAYNDYVFATDGIYYNGRRLIST